MTNYTVADPGTPTAAIVPAGIAPTNQACNVGNNFSLPAALAGAAGNGGLYQILGNDFTATFQAIAAAGQVAGAFAPVHSRARRAAGANCRRPEAFICPAASAYTSVGTSGATIPTINGTYQNVGIILNVTPFIGANGLVQMILQPQITSDGHFHHPAR